ncbi:MAG: two-component regulator propeller domain-containing protein [Ferruginibacter sp.]
MHSSAEMLVNGMHKWLLFFLLLFFSNLLSAADSLTVTRLSIQNGLSNNSVRCVYQDKKGFIWFGTYDGLNRYDGSQFKVFRNKIGDSSSLSHNYIYTMHEDRFNNLWVGTGQGISIYNNNTAKFSPARFIPYQSAEPQRASFNANIITSDQNGHILVGSNGWGLIVQKANEKMARQVPLIENGNINTGYNLRCILATPAAVWLFISEKGLYKYDIAAGKISPVNNEVKVGNCMLPDGNDIIWIGSEKGLYRYHIPSNTYDRYYSEENGKLSGSNVMSLCFDNDRNLWIGTDGGGISILENKSGATRFMLPEEGNNKISSESVYSIIKDREDRLWIGTIKGGCNIIDPGKNNFQTINHDPFAASSLPGNFIYSFCEAKDGSILIGTDGSGMSVWNRSKGSFKNYRHNSNDAASLSHNVVTSILEDHQGAIWVATFGGGINRFNKQSGSFKHYSCFNDSLGAENKNVWLLYEDRSLHLWATTFSNGKLYRYNAAADKFEVFSQQLNNLVSFFEDTKGDLWAGNSHQLIKIDRANKQHRFFETGKPIRAIWEDQQHQFWLGAESGGLILFDRLVGKIQYQYSDKEGLCNNSVLNIKEDNNGSLWLSTFYGISKFDAAAKSFKNFYQGDGLQSNQFSYNAALKLSSGEILFGGINGFNIFYPGNIKVRNYMPPLYITDISVNNRQVPELNEFILNAAGEELAGLRIPYNEAVLSLRFNALEYASPEKILYAYYLEGWDKGWNYAGNIRNINYNNLREGSYTLRIKNTNSNGVWNDKETTLKIIILPPWYRTWWAYLIYLVLVAAAGYLVYRYRTQQAKLKYEIQVTQLNAEKEKAINENRQSFFTNITHEFRTPLTMIINPVKDMLQKENEDAAKEELGIVHRNARRLLSLVDQLLLFKKTESDTGPLQVTQFNFYQLCHETYLYFVQQAKARSINYVFDCPDETLELYGDKEKLEIVFYNLLSNALKYTPEKGHIIFAVAGDKDVITVKIRDNGPGIPPHTGNRLFEKYYRVNEKEGPAKPGFGIGLYLVKEFIDKHRGQISYTSRSGEGTVFTVQLQKGTDHLGGVEVLQEDKKEHALLDEIAAGDTAVQPEEKTTTDGMESLVSEKPSILITDDNVQMRSYLVQVFQNSFIVQEAGSAEEGLKIARELQPDIIISDVVMNDMTGIDFCRAVKESPVLNHIPFILITGSFSPESKLKGIEYGADDYITKPFEKNMLVARVQSLIRNQQNLQKYFYNEITHQENSLNITGEYKQFLENCIAIVEKHLDDDDFNIQVLAREIGMSHSNLYKKIKTISGQSANAFIRFIRLRKAAEMFINTNYNINETAFYVGIRDIKYFREQFTKTFGLKPSEYIEKYRKTLGKNYKLNEKLTREKE